MKPIRQGSIRKFGKDGHVIFWGEAGTELNERISDQSVDLIFAEPPYGIGKWFVNFRDKWPSEADGSIPILVEIFLMTLTLFFLFLQLIQIGHSLSELNVMFIALHSFEKTFNLQ